MVGLELPLLAMEHMYLLTEPMPEVAEFNARDRARDGGRARPARARSTPGRSGAGSCSAPTRRTAGPGRRRRRRGTSGTSCCSRTSTASRRRWRWGSGIIPALENAGIKQVINGPFTFAPDGNPLVGPVQGLTNFWVACAVMAGFSQGGGRRAGAGELDDGAAIRGTTSSAWTWRGSASGRACATPTPRCGRTMPGASRSAFRTRSWPRRGRSRRRRSTTS